MSTEAMPAQGPVDVNVSRHCTCHPDDNPPTPCEHRYAFRDCADAAEDTVRCLAALTPNVELTGVPPTDATKE